MLKPFANPQYRRRTAGGQTGDECCICGRQTAGLNGALHVPVDHVNAEFVTEAQATERGDDVSLYPIGPECAKRWAREFGGKALPLQRDKPVARLKWDHQHGDYFVFVNGAWLDESCGTFDDAKKAARKAAPGCLIVDE